MTERRYCVTGKAGWCRNQAKIHRKGTKSTRKLKIQWVTPNVFLRLRDIRGVFLWLFGAAADFRPALGMAAQAGVYLTGQVAEDDGMFGALCGLGDDRAVDKFVTPGVAERQLVGPQEHVGVEERTVAGCCVQVDVVITVGGGLP